MTDSPWKPISTMPLGAVGAEVDILDERRLYSGVTVTGLRLEHETVTERTWDGESTHLGRVDEFTLTHFSGTIHLTPHAQWRPHV